MPELSQANKMIKTQQGSTVMTAYDFGYPSSYDSDASIPYEGKSISIISGRKNGSGILIT